MYNSMSETTTIKIEKSVRDRLAKIGKKNDSYSNIIESLLLTTESQRWVNPYYVVVLILQNYE